jgi:hypothetical protein
MERRRGGDLPDGRTRCSCFDLTYIQCLSEASGSSRLNHSTIDHPWLSLIIQIDNDFQLATKEGCPSHKPESIAVIVSPRASSAPVHTTVIFKRREQLLSYLRLRPDGTLGAGRCHARLSFQLHLWRKGITFKSVCCTR